MVHHLGIARTNIDIDDESLASVMRRYGFKTKREAVNFALRTVAIERMTRDELVAMRGSGWGGDLDELRGHGLPTTAPCG